MSLSRQIDRTVLDLTVEEQDQARRNMEDLDDLDLRFLVDQPQFGRFLRKLWKEFPPRGISFNPTNERVGIFNEGKRAAGLKVEEWIMDSADSRPQGFRLIAKIMSEE